MTTDAVPGVADPAEGSAVPEPSAPNIVHLANGHTVTLHPKTTIAIGTAAYAVARRASMEAILSGRTTGGSVNVETALIEGALAEVYLRYGIKAWDFTTEAGEIEPITPESIDRLLPYAEGGRTVSEAADTLYSGEVFRPLVKPSSESSRNGPTDSSTSPIPDSGSTLREPSGRSSRNGTHGRRSKR